MLTRPHQLQFFKDEISKEIKESLQVINIKQFLNLNHAGPIWRKKLQPRNCFYIFYSFELNLCRMVKLCIPKNPMFFVFRF